MERKVDILPDIISVVRSINSTLAEPLVLDLISQYCKGPELLYASNPKDCGPQYYIHFVLNEGTKIKEENLALSIVQSMEIFFDSEGSNSGKLLKDDLNSDTRNVGFLVTKTGILGEEYLSEKDLVLIRPCDLVSDIIRLLGTKLAYDVSRISVSSTTKKWFATRWIKIVMSGRGYMSHYMRLIWRNSSADEYLAICVREQSFNTFISKWWEERKKKGCSLKTDCRCEECEVDRDDKKRKERGCSLKTTCCCKECGDTDE